MKVDDVKKWRIRDIIDLEYFLHQDAVSLSAEDQQYVQERDRKIFLGTFGSGQQVRETPERRLVIRAWLDMRREDMTARDTILPGESFESLLHTLQAVFVMIGLIAGGGAGLSFLTYTGDRPLNVFVYLAVFVFAQILLLLLLLILYLYRLRKSSFWSSSPLYRAIGRFMLRFLLAARDRVSGKMGSDRRSRMESILGLIVQKGRTYGFLFVLPVFILTQLFAIGFNLGLLATTLFKVITADIAFGWQSTLQLSPGAVHTLVQKIALPWSWLVKGDLAFPSLAQIEGSRIILKEGIYHLSTQALVSWWPFLCFSLLFYGLLPRLLLFMGAIVAQHRHLSVLDFRQGACEQLLLRMTTPLVTTRGRRVEGGEIRLEETGRDYGAESRVTAADKNNGRNVLVLIPEDIFAAGVGQEIENAVHRRFGFTVREIVCISEEPETDAELLAGLKKRLTADEDLLLIQEAWQPPIQEYINFIRNLRQIVGPGPCIRIGLIGRPLPDTILTRVKEENRKIWTRRINAIGDPCIYTEGMVNNGS